jgi:hypothetical protein
VRAELPTWLDTLRGALASSVTALALGSGPVNQEPGFEVDAELPLSHVTPRLVRELEQLGPFGQANPVPRLLVRSARVLLARRVGDGSHLQLTLGDGRGAERRGIFFRAGERAIAEGDHVDAVFTPSISVWNGRERIDLELVEVTLVADATVAAIATTAIERAATAAIEIDLDAFR